MLNNPECLPHDVRVLKDATRRGRRGEPDARGNQWPICETGRLSQGHRRNGQDRTERIRRRPLNLGLLSRLRSMCLPCRMRLTFSRKGKDSARMPITDVSTMRIWTIRIDDTEPYRFAPPTKSQFFASLARDPHLISIWDGELTTVRVIP